jgi:fatty-acyl-CoA synthase
MSGGVSPIRTSDGNAKPVIARRRIKRLSGGNTIYQSVITTPMDISDKPQAWEARRLIDLISSAADEYGDATLFEYRDTETSYAAFESRVWQLMEGLWSAGLRPAERVGIVMEDIPEAVVATVATSSLGCPPLVLSARNTPHELAHLLNAGDANTVIVQRQVSNSDLLERHSAVFDGTDDEFRVPTLERVVSVSGDEGAADPAPLDGVEFVDYRTLVSTGTDVDRSPAVMAAVDDVAPDDVALTLFTSGTTSAPKAVIRTNRNLLPHAVDAASWYGISSGDVLLNAYPIPSAAGVLRFLMTVAGGATCILQDHYTLETTMAYLTHGAVTHLSGPDTVFKDILEHPEASDMETDPLERIFLSMGGGLDIEFGRRAESTFATPIENAYGLTEANPLLLRTRREDPFEARVRPGGKTGYGTEVRLDGEGTRGEICVRGISVTPGYENDPSSTDAAFDEDGWFHTNDQGRAATIDGDRFVFFSDLADAMFQVGGFNVSPVEVEACLREHPAVEWAGVAGLDHERLGAVPAAIVTTTEDVRPAELTEFCESRLSDQKVPRTVFIIEEDEIPYSTGAHGRKIDRAGIGELLADRVASAGD